MFYGSQYYRPPFPREECWEQDFQNMRELGFNQVKFWAVWNWIEPVPGQFDFSELDKLVALAREHGLKVVINLIPEGAPYWTCNGDDSLYLTADGQRVSYGGPANIPSAGWPGRCMDDPEFAQLVQTFIEATARHFADDRTVMAFDVWNEPHLEPMYDYRSNMLCYCKHSRAAFVTWLQEKYGTLDALGDAWYRKYTSWSQVEPPPRFGTWADMLDWRRFWLDNLTRWLRLRIDACRRGAPHTLVQTHVAYSGILGNRIVGGLANELGDEFLLAKHVDLFGLSSFPKWLMGEEHYYRHLLHNEMVSQAAQGRPFYQVELQGGAGKPGLLGGEVPTSSDILVWNYNTVVSGGKGSVYWQYAPEPAGIESPGFGLTGFRGENTPRSLSAKACAEKLNLPVLDRAVKVSATNAVYVSRDTDLLCFASERREEMYAGSLSGIFKAAYGGSIPVRFLHQDQLETLLSSGIKVLYLPMPLVLSQEETAAFERFLSHGGTLVSEACPGLYRKDGLLEQECESLRRLFHVEHVEVQGLKDWGEVGISLRSGNHLTGRFYRQLVDVAADVEILGSFDDGRPAVTSCRQGAGLAIWIGSYPSYHFEHTGDPSTGNFLCDLLDPIGYAELNRLNVRLASVSSPGSVVAPVVRLLETDKEYILTMVNHCTDPAEISVEFSQESLPPVDIHLPGLDGNVLVVQKKL